MVPRAAKIKEGHSRGLAPAYVIIREIGRWPTTTCCYNLAVLLRSGMYRVSTGSMFNRASCAAVAVSVGLLVPVGTHLRFVISSKSWRNSSGHAVANRERPASR